MIPNTVPMISAISKFGKDDLVVGIATSGRTPYVLGAVREARRRGASTVGLACNRPSLLGSEVDLEIAPLVGAEVICRIHPIEGGNRHEDDLEHDLNRSDGANRQDARQSDGGPHAVQ